MSYVYLVSAVAALSGLLFGFDTAVINGALVFLRQQFALTTLQTEIATTSLLVGAVGGAGLAGPLSDWRGRKPVLILSALLFALSSVGAAVAASLGQFAAARLVGGIAIGVASVLAPIYIAELAPAGIRGRLVALNQLAIVTGILLAYLVNWSLSHLGSASWRWMFGSAVLPSLLFFVALLVVPESPRWLTGRGRGGEARAVLERVGGSARAEAEMRLIAESIREEGGAFSLAQLLTPGLRLALLIAMGLAILQQVTGINTVIYYGSLLFRDYAGRGQSAAIGLNVAVGLVNLVMTLVAMWVIDRLGRRPLLMIAAGGMAVSLLLLGFVFRISPPPVGPILGLVLVYVASFAVGLGPGVWVVMSEFFPTRIRGRAMGIATLTLWVACTTVALTFLSLAEAVTVSGAFWIYAALCVVTVLFVWALVPETKGRSLEEIERLWKHG